MIDLAEKIIESGRLLQTISLSDYLNSVDALQEVSGFKIDWDKGSGEEWGCIFSDGNKVLIFCGRLPLIFVDNQYAEQIEKLVGTKAIILSVDDWDAKIYTIDTQKTDLLLKWHSDISSIKISINDLWFATI